MDSQDQSSLGISLKDENYSFHIRSKSEQNTDIRRFSTGVAKRKALRCLSLEERCELKHSCCTFACGSKVCCSDTCLLSPFGRGSRLCCIGCILNPSALYLSRILCCTFNSRQRGSSRAAPSTANNGYNRSGAQGRHGFLCP
jgi:hypothetical protein